MPDTGVEKVVKAFMTTRNNIFIFLILLCFNSCGDDDGIQTLGQQLVPVDITIDLSSPQYQDLRQANAFAYVEGGRRGIVVLNSGFNSFSAFERSCTFQPDNSCARVSVHPSRQFMVDSCCSSQFDLNGQVKEPPATEPLIPYNTFLIGNELRITFP